MNYLRHHSDVAAIRSWHTRGVAEAQVALIVAFSSSVLLGQVFLIFFLTVPMDPPFG